MDGRGDMGASRMGGAGRTPADNGRGGMPGNHGGQPMGHAADGHPHGNGADRHHGPTHPVGGHPRDHVPVRPREPFPPDHIRRVRIRLVGQVQGVGLRYHTWKVASALGLTGWARNEPDGSVLLELQGPDEAIRMFFGRFDLFYADHPLQYFIDDTEDIPPIPHDSEFSIRR